MKIPTLPCPSCGHKGFEKQCQNIVLGDIVSPTQISHTIRPSLCITDQASALRLPIGFLQQHDLYQASKMFCYPHFINRTFFNNEQFFRLHACKIYQFQRICGMKKRVFGIVIVDEQHRLIDYCVNSKNVLLNRTVIRALISTMCTSASVI